MIQSGGSLIPIPFIGMGMVDIGKTIPNPFDLAQGIAAIEAATHYDAVRNRTYRATDYAL